MFASSEEVCSISAHRRVLRRATRRRRKQRRLAACHPRSPTRAHPTLRPLPGRQEPGPQAPGRRTCWGDRRRPVEYAPVAIKAPTATTVTVVTTPMTKHAAMAYPTG